MSKKTGDTALEGLDFSRWSYLVFMTMISLKGDVGAITDILERYSIERIVSHSVETEYLIPWNHDNVTTLGMIFSYPVIFGETTRHVWKGSSVIEISTTYNRIVLGTWECCSPMGRCIYDIEEDSSWDFCLYCDKPHERK